MRSVGSSSGRSRLLFAVTLLVWGISAHLRALSDDKQADGKHAEKIRKVPLKTQLRSQDNKELSFDDLIKDKIVIVNLMYTQCPQ